MMPQQFMRPMPYSGGNAGMPAPQSGTLNWTTPQSRPADVPYREQPASTPVVRGQSPDEAPLASAPLPQHQEAAFLHISSPEELGIASGSAPLNSTLDWNAVHARLGQLNASFQSRHSPQGYFEFTCLLPTARAGQTHRIEAHAASEAEAVRLALDKIDEWAGKQ